MNDKSTGDTCLKLGELADRIGAHLQGDKAILVDGIASLESAKPGKVSPFLDKKLREQAEQSLATALIVPEGMDCAGIRAAKLTSKTPQIAFARAMRIFAVQSCCFHGIHPGATVSETAALADDVNIGPGAVLGSDVKVGAGTTIGENVVLGSGCRLGARCVICAGVVIERGVCIGDDVLIQSGAVIGADGFGFASDGDKWFRIVHTGSVRIGNAVSVGPLTSIARGTLDDTVVEDGVIMDAQVLVAHNVHIGENTAIAGRTSIAGSTKIGARCQIGGAAGIAEHLQICDDVILGGMSRVAASIDKEGYYASHFPLQPAALSARNSILIAKLGSLYRRMQELEKKLARMMQEPQEKKFDAGEQK